jgi:glycerophosphoryl diester phosphodiesterase
MQNNPSSYQQLGINENKTGFDTQGHRGCRGLMPENTIPAMLKAMDLGVHTLEMDICFSKDLQAFLSHEPFLNHEITTQPNGQYINEEDEKKLQYVSDELRFHHPLRCRLKTSPPFSIARKDAHC